MKYARFILLPIVGLLLQTGLTAQNTWTLEQCIKYAWDSNISIQQQALTAEQSANTLFQSKMNFIPSVSARASYNTSWGRSVDINNLEIIENQKSQSLTPNISASINLFEGLQKINTVKRNKADYQAALQDIEQLRNQLSLEIARAYLQILLTKEMLTTAEKSRENVAQQYELTRKFVEAGSQPYSNLLDIDAQLATEEVQCVNARNQVDIAYLTLRQLLDIDPYSTFEIVIPEIHVTNVIAYEESTIAIYEQAKGLPQIKTAEFRRESAEHALAIAKGRYWPTLSFSASYGTVYSGPNKFDFWDQIRNNRSPALNFVLSVPLFQNWSIVTGSKNARLNWRIAQLEVDRKHQALYKDIQQTVTDASAAYNKYQASVRNVTAMEESFRYTQQKFDVGSVNSTDFTVAKNNLFRAESEMLQSKYQYIFQLKIIDFYKGIPITL